MKKRLSVILTLVMVLMITSFSTEFVSAATVTVSGSDSITIKGDLVRMKDPSGKKVSSYTLTKNGVTIDSDSYSATSDEWPEVDFSKREAGSYVLKYKAQKVDIVMRYVSGQGYVYRTVYSGTVSNHTVYITNLGNGSGGSSGSSSSGSSTGGSSGSTASTCGSYGHTYTDNCDESCNRCGYIRVAPHNYGGSCDVFCNSCNEYRATSYSCTYSDSCDETCNVCGTIRYVSHEYSANCDVECDLCGAERVSTASHGYSGPCGTVCYYCGYERTAPHDYQSECDTICNGCGEERSTYASHSYDTDCDAACADCGYERTAPHNYEWSCDEICNDCGAQRKTDSEHYYFDDCETACFWCDSQRVAPHEFDYDCQSTCSDCTYTRVPLAEHVYDNSCDSDCNACDAYRDIEHDFSVVEYEQATMNRDGAWWMACSICGEDEMDFEYIYSPDSISLSKTSYTYDGKVKSPEVIVKDWMGNTISPEYYTVKTPAGRKNVGKYTYTIEFQERYSGTEELTFIITPKATSVKKLTPAKKAFTVKLNKVSKQADGYEIMYAADSKFTKGKKTAKVPYKTTSKKISKLSAKKTYYVKVRTYKKVGGKMMYSGWSKVKKVKTK